MTYMLGLGFDCWRSWRPKRKFSVSWPELGTGELQHNVRAARKAVKTVAGRAEPVPGVIKGGIWPVLSRDYKGPRDPKNTKIQDSYW